MTASVVYVDVKSQELTALGFQVGECLFQQIYSLLLVQALVHQLFVV